MEQLTINYKKNGLDINEAPEGFYAQLKEWKGYNICNDCDAIQLCRDNLDDWCKKNKCMSYETIEFGTGAIIKRKDGQSVIFKKIN